MPDRETQELRDFLFGMHETKGAGAQPRDFLGETLETYLVALGLTPVADHYLAAQKDTVIEEFHLTFAEGGPGGDD